MPRRPASPCNVPTCPNMKPCPVHPGRPAFESSSPRRRYGSSGWAWQRLRDAVIARDGGICQLRLAGCTAVATTADHIVSPRAGGSDASTNLRASCLNCNEVRRRAQVVAQRNHG